MFKKIIAVLLAVVMITGLVGCGGEKRPAQSGIDKEKRNYDESDPTAVLNEITNDFNAILTALNKNLDETFEAVGTTFEDYQKNKGLINEWIELAASESDALFERTRANSIAYCKLIAEDPKHEDREFCDDAMDEYYDAVCDDAMDEYYDQLYDDAMDAIYDQYYDGIIDDAYDSLEYDEWSAASSESYETWSEGNSVFYEKWSEENSYLYGLWSAMNSAFCWNDNFDVDSIIADFESERAKADEKKSTDDNDSDDNGNTATSLEPVYSVNSDGTAEVVGFTGDGDYLSIDISYDGHDVVRIADSAFANCTTLESIVIWAEIVEIGDSAFKGCTKLSSISIPYETTNIGNHAFEDCTGLESLIIWGSPDIGEYAFANCTGLTSIDISSETKNIGAHAFEDCTGVTSLLIWDADIIGDYAFAGCTSVQNVDIPYDTKSIGNHAFDGCSELSYVNVWNSDTKIGVDAFANCPKLSDPPKN